MKIALIGDANSINVQRWQQGLVNAGAEVYLLSIHIQAASGSYILPISTPHLAGLPEKLRYFAAVPAARQLVKQLAPDLVMGYFVTGYGTLAALLNLHPLVLVTSGDDILIAPNHPLLRHLVRFNLHQADLIVTWAEHMAVGVQKLGIPDEKIVTLPRGIPTENFVKLRSPQTVNTKSIRIISTRSLYAVYQIDILIQATHLLRQKGIDCYLTIVGDGPERPQLEHLTDELGLKSIVNFTGPVLNDQLPPLLAEHHFYTSVIKTDGVSASLLEAMAAGLFPIVIDNAANRSWITSGENGLLIREPSAEALAYALQTALHNTDMRQRAWAINRQLIFERGDLKRNTAKYLDRFTELVEMYHLQR